MPTVIVLHRFGGVTQRILHNHLTECLGAGYDPHSGQINLSKSLYGLLRVGLSTNYVVLQGKDSSYLVLRMADPALHIPQAANKSHDKMNSMNFPDIFRKLFAIKFLLKCNPSPDNFF